MSGCDDEIVALQNARIRYAEAEAAYWLAHAEYRNAFDEKARLEREYFLNYMTVAP